MLNPHDERTHSALTTSVLDKLRKNLDEHKVLVATARQGYLAEAERLLKKRLRDLRSGKSTSLHFNLAPVQDHSRDYETVISILELHLEAGGATIQLNSQDVIKYIRNEWDWKRNFDEITTSYVARVK